MSKSLTTLTLENVNVTKEIPRGDFIIDDGRQMRGIPMLVKGTLNKSDASTTTLALADKLALLGHLEFYLEHGPADAPKRIPFNFVDGSRVRLAERESYQRELALFSDTTDGLGKTIAASGDTAVAFYVTIPTGMFFKLRELREVGMGPSQCRNVLFKVRRKPTTPSLPTATTVTWKASTAITVEIFPDLVSGPDQELIVPEYLDSDQVGKNQGLPEGFPLLFTDRNAATASTSLAEFNLSIDGEAIHTGADPKIAIQEYRRSKPDEDVSDTDTLLHWVKANASIQDQPSGLLLFEQPKLNLSTVKWFALHVPIISEDAWAARVAAAAIIRGRALRATTSWAAKGYVEQGYHERYSPFLGTTYFQEGETGYQRFYGLVARKNPAGAYVADILNPTAQLAAHKARVAAFKGSGQHHAAEKLARAIVASVPGGVQSGNGFARGNSQANRRIRAALGL